MMSTHNLSSQTQLERCDIPNRRCMPGRRRHKRVIMTVQNVVEQSNAVERVTQSSCEWASSLGIDTSKLAVGRIGGLRGLVASQTMDEDTVMVTVPRAAAFTLSPTQSCPCPDFVTSKYWKGALWYVRLAIVLLKEKKEGEMSRFNGYIQDLPTSFDTPVNWEEERLQLLQYPYLIHKIKEQQGEWRALYEDLCKEGLVRDQVSRDTFYWALSCVRSRSFSGPYIGSTLADRLRVAVLVLGLGITNTLMGGIDLQKTLSAVVAVMIFNILYEVILSSKLKQYTICPFVDFMNHVSDAKSEVTYDYFQDRYSVRADRLYHEGDQVYVSYGRQSNDSLLQYYGFVEADNPNDIYLMTGLLKWVEELQPTTQQRLDALNQEGMLGSLQEVVVSRDGFPASTLQSLRYLLADESHVTGSSPRDFKVSGEAAQALEKKLALVLVHACQRELQSLGTSVEEDKKLLKQRGTRMNPTDRLAVRFRLEKKKVLRSCIDKLTSER